MNVKDDAELLNEDLAVVPKTTLQKAADAKQKAEEERKQAAIKASEVARQEKEARLKVHE